MPLPPSLLATIPLIQYCLTSPLLFTAGIATSFNLFLLPILKLNPSTTAISQLLQITHIGARTLDPANVAVALALVLVSILQAIFPEFAVAASWRVPALAGFVLFQVAWWERVMIFPLEREAERLRGRVEGKGKGNGNGKGGERTWMELKESEEFHGILDRWAVRHLGRVMPPLVAVVMLVGWRGSGDGHTEMMGLRR